MAGSLAGRIALVTGASRGIGAAIARTLAREGADVLLVHRDSQAKAETVLRELPAGGHRILQASITDSAALRAAAESIAQREGRLDILINNAGTTRFVPHGDLDALDDALIDQILTTNVRGTFACTRAMRPLLDKSEDAVIINISSIAGRTGFGSNIVYCASKAAVDNMTISLARALGPKIRVLSVSPGVVDTELTRGWDPAVRQKQIDLTPLKRLATIDEVAQAVLAAITLFKGSTGCVFAVDGGRPHGV